MSDKTDKTRELIARAHENLSALDLDNKITREGTAWGSYLREAKAALAEALEALLPGDNDQEELGDSITIPRPVVPHGPAHMTENQATGHYLREVVRKIESGHITVGGSNVTRTVKALLASAALATERLPVEEVPA